MSISISIDLYLVDSFQYAASALGAAAVMRNLSLFISLTYNFWVSRYLGMLHFRARVNINVDPRILQIFVRIRIPPFF